MVSVIEPFDYDIALSICALCTTYSTLVLLQLYRALRAAAGKKEDTEGSTTVTEHSIVDGLDNLQKYMHSICNADRD